MRIPSVTLIFRTLFVITQTFWLTLGFSAKAQDMTGLNVTSDDFTKAEMTRHQN